MKFGKTQFGIALTLSKGLCHLGYPIFLPPQNSEPVCDTCNHSPTEDHAIHVAIHVFEFFFGSSLSWSHFPVSPLSFGLK